MKRSFCHDDIWNINETWYSDVPDVSMCFQNIVLVLIPCTVFSIASIISLWRISNFTTLIALPWTWRNITKMVLCLFLLCISVVWCGFTVHQLFCDEQLPLSAVISSFSRSVTFVVVCALMIKHRSSGIVTSHLLSYFWICFSICGIIMQRSLILNKDTDNFSGIDFICGMIYYPIIYVELILSTFIDSRDVDTLENGKTVDEASFLSSITYMWFNKIVCYGVKRNLTVKDFFPQNTKLKSSYLNKRFSTYWNLTSEDSKQSLTLSLFKAFWPWIIMGLILDIIYIVFLFIPPLLLDRILYFVQHETYEWRGYLYCGTIFASSFIGKALWNNYAMYVISAAAQVKSSLINAIFRKNLLLSCAARKDFTSGSIMNLMSVDTQRISQFAIYATNLVCSPFRIIMIIVLMWQYLGPSCLAGVVVIFFLIPVCYVLSRKSEEFTDKQMEVKDVRLKLMNEILNGIKILKLYAWEVPFSLRISSYRKEEVKFIRLSQMCFIFLSFVFSCAPILVSIACFTTYLLTNSKHILDPTTAFVSLNLLDQLKFALFTIPDAISELIQTITALNRIRTFLLAENSDPSIVGKNTKEGEAVSINDATFSWSRDSEFSLKNITLHVPEGKLVAVIGPVGSGKSSLLSAVLGEMVKKAGSIDLKGSIAYAPQEAWILNRTLKNNILFAKHFNEEKYKQVVKHCCLEPDLKILPGGDETEIGEKGINLSGGQKHRVSLARAVYQDREIYLLDDPLSAVDAHVRKALFKDVIGNNGMLKGKTRILATHDISVLPKVDLIVRMNDGEIAEIGTYEELMKKEETFMKFIQMHTAAYSHDSATSSSKPQNTTNSTLPNESTVSSLTALNETASVNLEKSTVGLIDDERMEIGGVKRGIYFNYAKHVGFKIIFIALIGYVAFTTFQTCGNIWVSKWSADSIVNGTQSHSQTVWRLSIYSAFGLAQTFTIIFGTAFLVYGSTKASMLYHIEMLQSVLKSPMSFFDTTPLGRIVNRFSTDMDTLDIHLVYNIDGWIFCLLASISSVIIIGMNIPIFLAAIIPLAIVYYIFLKLHLNTSRQIKRLESSTKSPIYSNLLESIQGVMPIKAFKVQQDFIESFQKNIDNNIACYYQTAACNRWLAFWLDSIGSCVVFIAAYLAVQDRHNLGPSVVGLIITYALGVTSDLMWLVRTNTELENQSVAIERIDEYCKLASEAPWNVEDNDPDVNWPENGSIVFDNYSTRYRENLDLILHEINLSILSNEKVGIVGRTGAGKSSITLALFRIIEPASGAILIDNVDHSQIGLHTLRSKLTIIPQDPVLFTGTLRFNIDPNDEYSDADLWTSLSNAHLKDFVSNLQEGLEYQIEESGSNLSAGQKQLLCLSRALLKKTKILVLDEATAAVDMDTDHLIQKTIKSEFANHTVITIAHRLNTIMDYDKIIVMDLGKIVEVGNPRELLQDGNSQFYAMAKETKLL